MFQCVLGTILSPSIRIHNRNQNHGLDNAYSRRNLHRPRDQWLPAGRVLIAVSVPSTRPLTFGPEPGTTTSASRHGPRIFAKELAPVAPKRTESGGSHVSKPAIESSDAISSH